MPVQSRPYPWSGGAFKGRRSMSLDINTCPGWLWCQTRVQRSAWCSQMHTLCLKGPASGWSSSLKYLWNYITNNKKEIWHLSSLYHRQRSPYWIQPILPRLLAKFFRDIYQGKMLSACSIIAKAKMWRLKQTLVFQNRPPAQGQGHMHAWDGKFSTWPDITTVCLALLNNNKFYFALFECNVIVK